MPTLHDLWVPAFAGKEGDHHRPPFSSPTHVGAQGRMSADAPRSLGPGFRREREKNGSKVKLSSKADPKEEPGPAVGVLIRSRMERSRSRPFTLRLWER